MEASHEDGDRRGDFHDSFCAHYKPPFEENPQLPIQDLSRWQTDSCRGVEIWRGDGAWSPPQLHCPPAVWAQFKDNSDGNGERPDLLECRWFLWWFLRRLYFGNKDPEQVQEPFSCRCDGEHQDDWLEGIGHPHLVPEAAGALLAIAGVWSVRPRCGNIDHPRKCPWPGLQFDAHQAHGFGFGDSHSAGPGAETQAYIGRGGEDAPQQATGGRQEECADCGQIHCPSYGAGSGV